MGSGFGREAPIGEVARGDEGQVGDPNLPRSEPYHASLSRDNAEFASLHPSPKDFDERAREEGFGQAHVFLHENAVHEFVEAAFAPIDVDDVFLGGSAGTGFETDSVEWHCAEALVKITDRHRCLRCRQRRCHALLRRRMGSVDYRRLYSASQDPSPNRASTSLFPTCSAFSQANIGSPYTIVAATSAAASPRPRPTTPHTPPSRPASARLSRPSYSAIRPGRPRYNTGSRWR